MAEPLTLYKLIILYMLNKVDFPLTNSQISEFILDRGYTNYFHLQQAISELSDSNLVETESVGNATHFHITNTGVQTIHFFEKEISEEIKQEIVEYMKANAYELRDDVSTIADYYKEAADEYVVRCQVKEKNTRIIDLTLSVPGEEEAQAICGNWKEKSQTVYAYLMKELL
ncbi:MAG: DUF4364 family protein [Lachnospiraceae bacterium]|jgi:predicted transcriptional regulator